MAMIRTGMRIGRVELVDSHAVGPVNAYRDRLRRRPDPLPGVQRLGSGRRATSKWPAKRPPRKVALRSSSRQMREAREALGGPPTRPSPSATSTPEWE